MIDFTKIFPLKGQKPKNKGHTNFYECCDLTKKVYLVYVCALCIYILHKYVHRTWSSELDLSAFYNKIMETTIKGLLDIQNDTFYR